MTVSLGHCLHSFRDLLLFSYPCKHRHIKIWWYFPPCNIYLPDYFSCWVQYEVHQSHLPGCSGVRTLQPTEVKVVWYFHNRLVFCRFKEIIPAAAWAVLQSEHLGNEMDAWDQQNISLSFPLLGSYFFKSSFFPKLPWLDSTNNINLNWFLGRCPN